MARVNTETLDVDLEALLLDEENPRLGSAKSQSDALQKIIELNPVHFRNMMASIKENGTDPGDSLYVIEDEVNEGDYIVLDGNRRLSAIKVLCNPILLDGTSINDRLKKRLQKISEDFEPNDFDELRCVRFKDREEANQWIYRRHTGGADGEGRIDWGPLEIARFTHDRSVTDLLAFVGRNADMSDEDWEEKRKYIESKQSSNIERLLTSSAGKAHLGLTYAKDEHDINIPMTVRPAKLVLDTIVRIIDDLVDGKINSRDINKASDIEDYFASLPPSLQPNDRENSTPTAICTLNLDKTKHKNQKNKGDKSKESNRKTRPVTGKRLTLAPRRLPFSDPEIEKAIHILGECTKIKLSGFEISCAFLLRAFLEITLRHYAKQNEIPLVIVDDDGKRTPKALNILGAEVKKHIINSNANAFNSSDLRSFQSLLLTQSSNCSVQSLNNFVHNSYAIPTADTLRAAWEACNPVFIAAYGSA